MSLRPMLCQSADPAKLIELAADPAYAFQQKLDGFRIMVVISDGEVRVLNRNGESSQTELPASIRVDLARLPKNDEWVLDCELMADKTLWVFDLPRAAHFCEENTGFTTRHFILESLFRTWRPQSDIRLLPLALDQASKLALAEAVLKGGGEGLIAKSVDGRYLLGKRSSATLKLKFYKDIDCVVTDLGRDGKSNMGLAVYDGNSLVDLGEVTSLAGDGPRVKVGDVVCVKFLYAVSSDRPRLVQPTLPRLRDDKTAEQCTIDQLDHAYRNLNVLTAW